MIGGLVSNLLILERTPTVNTDQCGLALGVVSEDVTRRAIRAFDADLDEFTHVAVKNPEFQPEQLIAVQSPKSVQVLY